MKSPHLVSYKLFNTQELRDEKRGDDNVLLTYRAPRAENGKMFKNLTNLMPV